MCSSLIPKGYHIEGSSLIPNEEYPSFSSVERNQINSALVERKAEQKKKA